jgi:hypothetical protein
MLAMFRDGIEVNIDLKFHAVRSSDLEATVSRGDLRDWPIPRIEEFPESQAIVFMDNCSSHLAKEVVDLLSAEKGEIHHIPTSPDRCLVSVFTQPESSQTPNII